MLSNAGSGHHYRWHYSWLVPLFHSCTAMVFPTMANEFSQAIPLKVNEELLGSIRYEGFSNVGPRRPTMEQLSNWS